MTEVLNKPGSILLEVKERNPVVERVGDGSRNYGFDCIEHSDKPDSRTCGGEWPDGIMLDIYIYGCLKWFIIQ